jgi:hypothetical protein
MRFRHRAQFSWLFCQRGLTPAAREQLQHRFRGRETAECPFANLPEALAGRWGDGLNGWEDEDCRWIRPVLVAQFEFVEWTADRPEALALRGPSRTLTWTLSGTSLH